MKPFESRIDVRSEDFKTRKNGMLDLMRVLNERQTEIKTPREKAVAKLQKRGKYPARIKVEKIIDPGSTFHEIGLFAAYGMYEDIPGGYPAAGVITGIGTVSGKKAVIIANDPLVKSGAWVEITCKKNLRAQEIAMENRLPIIYMVDSAGVNLERQAEIFPDREHFGRIFRNNAKMAAMGIPQISCVFGFCVAGGAYLPGMSSDLAMITANSSMFLAGPFLVKSAVGQEVDMETLGGATMHHRVSGVADYQFDSEDDAFAWIRDQMAAVQLHPSPKSASASADSPLYDADELLGILPSSKSGAYDTREIIARLADGSRFEEFKPEYGATIVTAFAEMGGFPVGIVANQGKAVKKDMPPDHLGRPQPPQLQMGNVIYSDSANKATHFIMLCNERRIPLIFFHDVTGFMVGKQAENGGIIQDGSQFVNAQANAIVPKFSVVLRNSFGAGNYAMCGKAYDPRLIYSWPTAKLAVMDGGVAADTVLLTKRDLSDEEREAFRQKLVEKYAHEASPYYTAARMIVDDILDPRKTRESLINGLEIAAYNPPTEQYITGVMRM